MTLDPSQVMAPNRKIYALKRIKLQGRDAEAATGFIDEITLLQALRGKQNIIQLVDAEVRQPRVSCTAQSDVAFMPATRPISSWAVNALSAASLIAPYTMS